MEDIQTTESLDYELNQDEGLFDDLVTDDDMPTETETEDEMTDEEEGLFDDEEETEEIVSTPVKEKKAEPFLNIKYNKEEIGLTREEAKDLAEKGKNYDALRDRLNGLYGILDELAQDTGMNRDELLTHMRETKNEASLKKAVDQLAEMYPDTPREFLEEHAKMQIANKQKEKETQATKDQQTQVDNRKEEVKRQVDLFKKHYPNLQPDKLDNEVYKMMDEEGYSLLEAYSIFKDKQASSKSKVNELKELNKKRSYGNITNMGDVESDDFMSGFNS